MTGKAPAFQFYVRDWLADPELRQSTPTTRGIWIDLLCFLWESSNRGELEAPFQKLCRMTGATESEMTEFIDEAKEIGFCDISVTGNNCVTLRNRRMWRDEKDRKDNRKRQAKFRSNKKVTEEVTTPSSTSSSSSTSIQLQQSTAEAESETRLPTKDELENGSPQLTKQAVIDMTEKIYSEKLFPKVHAFKNKMVKEGMNDSAILHVLSRCYLKGTTGGFDGGTPWAYCQKIIATENGNYNERDYNKTA